MDLVLNLDTKLTRFHLYYCANNVQVSGSRKSSLEINRMNTSAAAEDTANSIPNHGIGSPFSRVQFYSVIYHALESTYISIGFLK